MRVNSLFLSNLLALRLCAKNYLIVSHTHSFLSRQSLPVFLKHRSIAGLMRELRFDQGSMVRSDTPPMAPDLCNHQLNLIS